MPRSPDELSALVAEFMRGAERLVAAAHREGHDAALEAVRRRVAQGVAAAQAVDEVAALDSASDDARVEAPEAPSPRPAPPGGPSADDDASWARGGATA